MTPEKALELVGRYARLARQIKDCKAGLASTLSKQTEALKLALEALKFALHVGFDESSESQIKKSDKAVQQHQNAITAIREALAEQPAQQQEPLFWYRPCGDGFYEGPHHNNSIGGKLMREEKPGAWHPLYPSPPASKPWVGLEPQDFTGVIKAQEALKLAQTS